MRFSLLIFSFLFLIAPRSNSQSNSQEGSSSEVRNVSGFNAISLSIPAQVILSKGNYSLEIKSAPSLLEKIKTEVHGNELNITMDNRTSFHAGEEITIHISMPEAEGLEVNGSGTISVENDFSGDHMHIEINGSGQVNTSGLSFSKMTAVINGSGNIKNSDGNASDVELEINGSGKISAESFTGKNVKATVTGSGSIRLTATEMLNAQVTGSGNVKYHGNPAKKNVDISGSGTVSSL